MDLREKFEALSIRERAIIAVTAIVAVWGVWIASIGGYLGDEVVAAERQVENLNRQLSGLAGAATEAVDSAQQTERARLEGAIAALVAEQALFDARLKEELAGFVHPNEITPLLKTLLESHPGLELIRLKNAAAEEILLEGVATGYYRHPLMMEFVGEYADILRYLAQAERAEQTLSWRSIDYEVEAHPLARVVLTLETISDSPDWIGV